MLANAGHYNLTYSQTGLAEQIGPLGTYSSHPYADTSDGGRGGSAVSAEQVSPGLWLVGRPGWAKCSGAITATFVWVRDFPTDDPPRSVILKQYASASWSGDSGSCDNGLGYPAIPSEDGWGATSQGAQTTVLVRPGEVIIRTCAPSAEAIVGATPPPGNINLAAGASVYYRAEAYAVELSLNGTWPDGTTVVGKRITGSMYLEPDRYGPNFEYSHSASGVFSNHVWNIAGPTFKQFYIAYQQVEGYPIFLQLEDLWLETPAWLWKDSGDYRVVVGADCTFNGTPIGRVQAEQTPHVNIPDYSGLAIPSDSYYIGYVSGVQAGSNFSPVGCEFRATVDGHQYGGNWAFAQLIQPYRVVNGQQVPGWCSNEFLLDNAYPYPDPIQVPPYFPADGNQYVTSDSPSQPGGINPDSMNVYDHFKMYVNYTHDDWTPLGYYTWSWYANFARLPNGTYPPQGDIGFVSADPLVSTRDHMEWHHKLTNGSGGPGGPGGGGLDPGGGGAGARTPRGPRLGGESK